MANPKTMSRLKSTVDVLMTSPSRVPMLKCGCTVPAWKPFTYGAGKVARGGIRWSDRQEDFRTEILGLIKAQMVKNSVIVPVGSKGGFVVKRPPKDGGAKRMCQKGLNAIKPLCGARLMSPTTFPGMISSLLDVVRHDEDDPYLVVAADKGTATFSDIANSISVEYGFWLDDAFASGGSQGYDHKIMGITARGAWEAVKRHFREVSHDTQTGTSPALASVTWPATSLKRDALIPTYSACCRF